MKTRVIRQFGFKPFEIMIVVVLVVVLGALAIPKIIKTRSTSSSNPCIAHLKQMDGAKQQWAVENKKLRTDVPTDSDIYGPTLYIRAKPQCQLGGTYQLNAVSVSPTCSKSAAPDFHTL